ncbi:Interferon-stimulated 20 kDa exonuclease-like 2 [Taenia crassiceps]|uniref:RNA exonuclease 4 n=1 Tax=Taenia crassiceps TaxID=6207 RepID=A0ABR4QFB7_9CEST
MRANSANISSTTDQLIAMLPSNWLPFAWIKKERANGAVSGTEGARKYNCLQYLRDNTFPEGPIALDCEMVGIGDDYRSALARVSIVAHDGAVLYDVISRPEEVITDYRTRWSGIRPSDMQRAIPFESVREQVLRIIENRVVVGHAIRNDFEVLKIEHPRDTTRDISSSTYAKAKARISTKGPVALRHLAYVLLGVRIQRKEHNSIEDAQATMAIYRLIEREWETELGKKTPKRTRNTKTSTAENKGSPSPSTQESSNLTILSDDEYWTAVEEGD